MKKNKVTQSDIAKELNLSRITVSKVLNGTGNVNKKTHDIVISKAKEMGYKFFSQVYSNATLESKTNNYRIITLIFSTSYDSSYWSRILFGISAALSKRNINNEIVLITEDAKSTLDLPKSLFETNIDGIITMGEIPDFLYEYFIKNNITVSFIGLKTNFINKIHSDIVTSENIYAYKELMDILCNKGYKSFAYISPKLEELSLTERWNGFFIGLHSNGIEINQNSIYIDGPNSHFTKYNVLKALNNFNEQPEVIVCANDLIGSIVYDFLQSGHEKLRKDTIIVGYDYSYEFRNLYSKLYNVDSRPEDISYEAVENLIARIQNPEAPQKIVKVIPKIIIPE